MRQDQTNVVLLAEDEPGVRKIVSLVLDRAGYTVLAAADGNEALQLSRAHSGVIDLLLTDVKMPNLCGPELAVQVKRERPEIRILLMSGHSSGRIPPAMLPGLLRKPFRPDELLRRIEDLLLNDGAADSTAAR
jgi:hypothetical protein